MLDGATVTRISGYLPDFRDFFDFRDHFKAFRVTLGRNVNNNVWLVWSKDTFAKIIFPDFRFFPDFREFFQAFMASRVIFGNNDINNFWLPLWLGSSLAEGCGCRPAAAAAAAAAATATAKVSAPAPATAATFV